MKYARRGTVSNGAHTIGLSELNKVKESRLEQEII